MSHIIKFEYGPQLRMRLMVVGFFSPCTVALAFMAKEKSAGLTINHVIEFSTGFATIFLGAGGLLCPFFIGGCLFPLPVAVYAPELY